MISGSVSQDHLILDYKMLKSEIHNLKSEIEKIPLFAIPLAREKELAEFASANSPIPVILDGFRIQITE